MLGSLAWCRVAPLSPDETPNRQTAAARDRPEATRLDPDDVFPTAANNAELPPEDILTARGPKRDRPSAGYQDESSSHKKEPDA